MSPIEHEELLLINKLRVTSHRLTVLACFGKGEHARTYPQILTAVKDKMDRISLYRILELLIRNEVLFRLCDNTGIQFYILNHFRPAKGELLTLIKCNHCNSISAVPRPRSLILNF